MAQMRQWARAATNARQRSTKRRRRALDFERYQKDPVAFAREVFGIDPWSRQAEILLALTLGYERVAIRSGHKISKSTTFAIAALWWLLFGPPGTRIVITAPTYRQVDRVLWREIRRMWRRAAIRGFVLTPEPPAKKPETGLRFEHPNGDASEVFGFTTDEPDAFSGISAPLVVYFIDEANGVAEDIFEALEGNAAGGARVFLAGNPTRTVGTFYQAFRRDLGYHRIHVSSEETPNVQQRRAVIPGLALYEWVQRLERAWGRDSPLFQVRVLGNFAEDAARAIVTLSQAEAAIRRWSDLQGDREELDKVLREHALELGVDPARFGDDSTVICIRRGPFVIGFVQVKNFDTVDVFEEVLQQVRTHRRPGERPKVKVDEVGLGAGVYDQLKRNPEVQAVPIDSGKNAIDTERFVNGRAEMHFAVREYLKDGGMLPDDEELQQELIAPEYDLDPRSRIRVTPKDELKSELGRSPDKADALALSVYQGKPAFVPKSTRIKGL